MEEAGGKVLGEPMDIPKVGSYVSFIDTEGNRVSMMQTLQAKDEDKKVKRTARARKGKGGKW